MVLFICEKAKKSPSSARPVSDEWLTYLISDWSWKNETNKIWIALQMANLFNLFISNVHSHLIMKKKKKKRRRISRIHSLGWQVRVSRAAKPESISAAQVVLLEKLNRDWYQKWSRSNQLALGLFLLLLSSQSLQKTKARLEKFAIAHVRKGSSTCQNNRYGQDLVAHWLLSSFVLFLRIIIVLFSIDLYIHVNTATSYLSKKTRVGGLVCPQPCSSH